MRRSLRNSSARSVREDPVNGGAEPLPVLGEHLQQLAAAVSQRVIAARRALVRLLPERLDQALAAQPAEQRVDRALTRHEPIGRHQGPGKLEPVTAAITAAALIVVARRHILFD